MTLRKEVLQRLLLAKSILAPARTTPRGQPNEHVVARQVLNAHDAADLVFAAIADTQGKQPVKGQSSSMMQALDSIKTTEEKHTGYFKQLNDARNGLKHAGNLPNTIQWASVAEDVYDKLSAICNATLNISLDEIDESELLLDADAKTYLRAAKIAREAGDFKLALEEIARALWTSIFNTPSRWVEVGRPNAEDALKLTAFGVPADSFLRLQEFMPIIIDYPAPVANRSQITDLEWKQSVFGHPGNWRQEVVDFCLDTYLKVALALQNASEVPYPMSFEHVYDYKVTATEDHVELWNDLIEEQLDEMGAFDEKEPSVRPFREVIRHLTKGESITLPGGTKLRVSDDRGLDGTPIQRLQVSNTDLRAILPHRKADFVNLSQFRITCTPKSGHNLPEIPYEQDDPMY